MENKSGFYKNDNGNLLFGVNSVISKDYNLQRDKHEEYDYPVDGWYWLLPFEWLNYTTENLVPQG